jgi:hypothetical protein
MIDDDVSVDELREAVERMHGVPARFVEAVEVDERFEGQPVWQGAVKVFALEGHPPGAMRVYAWSYRTEGTRRKFKAVLGVPPSTDRLWPSERASWPRYRRRELSLRIS